MSTSSPSPGRGATNQQADNDDSATCTDRSRDRRHRGLGLEFVDQLPARGFTKVVTSAFADQLAARSGVVVNVASILAPNAV